MFFMIYGWDIFTHFTNLESHTAHVKRTDWRAAVQDKRKSLLGRLIYNVFRFSEIIVAIACFVYLPILQLLNLNILYLTIIGYAILYNLTWMYLVITQHKYMKKD